MPLQIVALSGPLAGRIFPLGDAPLSLGRTSENTVMIASPLASRRHAELRHEGGGYMLYDLGSSNGTSVNGQRVQALRLSPGDVITIGDESFRFDAPAVDKTLLAAPAQPAPTQMA
ncbi:MAG: FHA domain-containing protein, partial [Chloroflexales bacterium]